LQWLPERFPAGVKVIVSTMKGTCYDICVKQRRWVSFELSQLNVAEKCKLTIFLINDKSCLGFFWTAWIIDQTLLDRQQMTLNPSQKQRIIGAPQVYLAILKCAIELKCCKDM